MSFQFDTLHISHQLTTGIGYPECLGFDKKIIRGSVYLDGPTITGDENTFKTIEGSVMIGPCNNEDSPLPKICDGTVLSPNWEIDPCGRLEKGNIKGLFPSDPYSLVVRSGTHTTRDETTACSENGAGPGPIDETISRSAAIFIGDVDITGVTRIADKLSVGDDGDFRKNLIVQEDIVAGGTIILGGTLRAAGAVVQSCGVKPFNIKHPDKEGWRLVHNCLEGPEVSVYFRGRVKNTTEINLPKYWKNLVHVDSITVNLTPIGAHQDIIVKRWDDEKIYLQSKGGMPIDCFYYVVAERKDVDKLVVEYEGTFEDFDKFVDLSPS
jgi:hypothetical protein